MGVDAVACRATLWCFALASRTAIRRYGSTDRGSSAFQPESSTSFRGRDSSSSPSGGAYTVAARLAAGNDDIQIGAVMFQVAVTRRSRELARTLRRVLAAVEPAAQN
jgi:hypothetical protein